MIDWARVAELRDEIGEDALAEVLLLFTEEVEEVVRRLAHGPKLAAELHFLKGSAANLGFRAFEGACVEAERRAFAGRTEDIVPGDIRTCYMASKDAFIAGLQGVCPEVADQIRNSASASSLVMSR